MSQQVIDFLNSQDDASEAVEVTSYRVYFGGREVTVNVRDRGASVGDTRFAVEAYWTRPDEESSDGRGRSFGNAQPSLQAALDAVHWWEFTPRED